MENPKEEPKQKNKKVCDCKRAYVNILSGICSLCWNEKFPNEKEEVKEEDLLEPKQETLEDAAEKIYLNYENNDLLYGHSEELQLAYKAGIVDGAKWQQENMYSEEDLFNFAIFCSNNHSLDDSDKDNICWQPIFKDNIKLTMKEMFEQFKKQQQMLPFFTNQNKMELNWENAKVWQEKANEKKEIFDEPKWSWDCNFKLDFDGSLLRISSRFYPPHKNAGDWWEGAVLVNFLGEEILRKEFKCNTLEELKTEVEKFTKHYAGAIKARLS